MARAWMLGVIGAAVMFGAPMAMAGGAPVAYYPSLGYGQTPPNDYDAYDDGAYDEPPPPVLRRPPPPMPPYAPGPGNGAPGAPPLPERFERRAYEPDAHGAERRRSYQSRSEFEAGYDSGWRADGARYRDDRAASEHAYAAARRDEYDYDSGWRARTYGAPPPPAPPPQAYRRGFAYEDGRAPDSFFADAGGVGPDEFEEEGGGGYVVGGASAHAFAEASARARVNVGVHLGRHRGAHRCGCRR